VTTCPHCCGTGILEHDTLTLLRTWCLSNGHHVTPDGAVYDHVAALILDRAPGTLSNWRANGGSKVPWYRISPTSRVRYRLTDLARFIDENRSTTFTDST